MFSKEFFLRPLVQLIFGGIVGIVVAVFFAAMTDWHNTAKTSRAVERNNTAANAHIEAADQSQSNAANSANVRAVEDLRRNEIIEPRRREANANANTARKRTQEARKRYEKAINSNSRNFTDDDVCRALSELYPNERFAGCNS